MTLWIEIVALIIMGGGVGGFLMLRGQNGQTISLRSIQYLAIVLTIPTVLILALENILSSEATSALVGAVIGYALSGLGRRRKTVEK
jgi:hypothetical protein